MTAGYFLDSNFRSLTTTTACAWLQPACGIAASSYVSTAALSYIFLFLGLIFHFVAHAESEASPEASPEAS